MPMRLIGSLAMIALVLSGPAQAAPANGCMSPEEIKGFVGYIMPDVVDGVVRKCGPSLRPDGYLNTRGSQLVARFAVGKEAAWPLARAAFRKMGGEFKGAPKAGLSERTIRALIDNEMVTKLVSELPDKMCSDIEQVVAPLDPLPAENAVQFVSAIFNVAGRDGSGLRACPPQ